MKRWIAVLLVGVVAVAGVGYWGYTQANKLDRTEVALANQYNRSFYNTLEHVQDLEVLLSKGLVTSGRTLSEKLFNKIWQQSTAGMDSITQLPVQDITVARTAKFLTQMGDFCRQMSEQVDQGKPMTERQYNTLKKLYRQAGELNSKLQEVENKVSRGHMSFVEMARQTGRNLGSEGKRLASSDFRAIDETMQEFPTLIYDGPFSEHLQKRDPEALKGKEKIDREKARDVARKFIDGKKTRNYVAQITGKVYGQIPAYRVELTPRKNGEVTGQPSVIDVSQKGGMAIWSVTPRDVEKKKISIEKARETGKKYLAERGFENMKATYYQKNDHTVTYNFVARQDGAVIYPDMIKLSVALDNGEVVAMDARGYVMNHRQRNLPEPALSEEKARKRLGEALEVKGDGRLAVIPTETYDEKLTWEFKGKMEGNTYLVYINARNGNEERILQLMKTENGMLTM